MAQDGGAPRKRSSRSTVLDSRPEYERLGRWLRDKRGAASIEQKPLSRLIGKPEQFINKVEHARQRIDVVEFMDVFRQLKLEPTDLLELLGVLEGKPSTSKAE